MNQHKCSMCQARMDRISELYAEIESLYRTVDSCPVEEPRRLTPEEQVND